MPPCHSEILVCPKSSANTLSPHHQSLPTPSIPMKNGAKAKTPFGRVSRFEYGKSPRSVFEVLPSPESSVASCSEVRNSEFPSCRPSSRPSALLETLVIPDANFFEDDNERLNADSTFLYNQCTPSASSSASSNHFFERCTADRVRKIQQVRSVDNLRQLVDSARLPFTPAVRADEMNTGGSTPAPGPKRAFTNGSVDYARSRTDSQAVSSSCEELTLSQPGFPVHTVPSAEPAIDRRSILGLPGRIFLDSYLVDESSFSSGQSGAVYKCVPRVAFSTQYPLMACKKIGKASMNELDISSVQLEVEILQLLAQTPGVVRLFDVVEEPEHIYIVMEFCEGGDLFDLISRGGALSESSAACILIQLVESLQVCHANGIMHRDIKPENILFLKQGLTKVKLCDFGVAQLFRPGETNSEFAGTPMYVAPEVILGQYGPSADVWSLGVVLYAMLCGHLPFSGETDFDILSCILEKDPDYQSPNWRKLSTEAKSLVGWMLTKNPAERPRLGQILGHPWIVGILTSIS